MPNHSSMVVSPVYTLVPKWLYNFLGLHQFYESSKYSVVTQMPRAMFSNQKTYYLLRCSTFTPTINLPFDAFHDGKLQRSLYDLGHYVFSFSQNLVRKIKSTKLNLGYVKNKKTN